MADREDLVIVGKLRRTHGLKGNLKVEIYPPNFEMPEKVYIKDRNGNFKELEVLNYSEDKGLIRFKGYENIDKAKTLTNKYIYTEEKNLPELEEDEFYIYQLKGKEVFFNGKRIGKVIEVDDRLFIANLIIKCADGKVRNLPFLNVFVKKIDDKNNRIEVEPPEGWLSI